MPAETPNPNIAHIRHGDLIFQVLIESGMDWDEMATRATYDAWLAENAGG
jgi:hypothetical protein